MSNIIYRLLICCIVVACIECTGMSTLSAQTTSVRINSRVAYEFTSVSAGIQHTCALTTVGTIYCWGDNSFGQLGIGSMTNQNTPTLVKSPVGVTFRTVSASGNHTCAMSVSN